MTILAMSVSSQDAADMEILQLKEKLTAYWNAVTLITANAHAITRTSLVPGDTAELPSWWPTLSANFTACKGHAQNWIDEVYPSLTRIPQAIINFDNAFSVTSNRMLDVLAQIQKQPTDALKAQFMSMLKYLLEQLGDSMTDINETRDAIKSFTRDMAADHTKLTTGSANIAKAIDDSDQSVAKLTARIEFLKLEIDRLNMQLTVAAIALTTSVTVSYALMSVAPYVSLVIAIVGIGVSTGFIIDALVRLREAQNEIIEDSAKLAREKRLVVVLRAMAATIDSIFVAINSITKHIDTVSSAWATIQTKMQSVITNIEKAKGRDWVDVILKELDIATAQKSWTGLRQYCEKLQEAMLAESGTVVPVKGAA
jgi:septation ring formation regulator EzrA